MSLVFRKLRFVALVTPLVAIGCSDDPASPAEPPADTGVDGSALPDGSLPDGSLPDTAPPDATPDATPPDGSLPETAPPDAAPDGSVDAPNDTATDTRADAPADGAADAPPVDTKIHVRVAHLSPDAPAVDVCVKRKDAADTTYVGPVLKPGLATGLAYSKVTGYLDLDPGAYTVRLVPGGAANCNASLSGLPAYDLPALPAGTWATAAAVGEAGKTPSTFTVKPFVDSRAPVAGKNTIRFVHASPTTPAVDVGVGFRAGFTRIWSSVSFPNAGSPTGADANGFVAADPAADVVVTARVAGSSDDALSVGPIDLVAGKVFSTFAIGLLAGTDDKKLSVLACDDLAAPTGGLSNCAILPVADTKAHVRVAHLSPDAPAVDLCVKPKDAADSAFVGPVLKASIAGGLGFGQLSGYLDLDPGTYTVRLVSPAATNCTTALASLPNIDLPRVGGGSWVTAAAIGEVGATPRTFEIKAFADRRAAPAAGKIAVRFVHASPRTPAVDVGLGKGASFTRVWANVAYPNVGGVTGADPAGFVTTDPLTNAAITARLSSAPTVDTLTVEPVSAPAGAIVSTFAIGLAGGTGVQRLSVLVCVDSAEVGGRTVCNRLP
jgi:hypothetical protein